jgi:hypothetical protein
MPSHVRMRTGSLDRFMWLLELDDVEGTAVLEFRDTSINGNLGSVCVLGSDVFRGYNNLRMRSGHSFVWVP